MAVSALWEEEIPSHIRLVTRELPVVYDIAKVEVEKLWKEEKPDVFCYFLNVILIFKNKKINETIFYS